MGTSYYMVKPGLDEKDRVYVGRSIMVVDLEDFRKDIETARKLCWEEDCDGYEIMERKPADLTVGDMATMDRIVRQHLMMVSLFERPQLLAFYLTHDNEEWDDWEIKSDYELEWKEDE